MTIFIAVSHHSLQVHVGVDRYTICMYTTVFYEFTNMKNVNSERSHGVETNYIIINIRISSLPNTNAQV